MGIPSFYKHLIQTIAGVTEKERKSPPAVFALDLNCAIYHCVRKVQEKLPYTPENRSHWEKQLIDTVIAYIKQMEAIVKPTEILYIAVDGVAPMAKIKQQRVRRFKSAVAAEQEARIKAEARGETYNPQPRWDTNAITPGTSFMSALATGLRTYAKTNPTKIQVSPADEPGEGEQKIMEWIRKKKPSSVVVYGLDADLIVLALWTCFTTSTHVDLFREEVEFNGVIKTDALNDEQFLYMNIEHLAAAMYETHARPDQPRQEFITDFVGLMSLLGNDFVPHGMALKIRDDGIQKLLEIYKTNVTMPLVDCDASDVWSYKVPALQTIFRHLAADEQAAFLRNIKKKLEARVGATAGKTAEERALAIYNDTPVTLAAEACMVTRVMAEGYEKPQLALKANWRTIYDAEALMGADPAAAADLYLEMLAWTLAYYSGAPIDLHAYYPWPLPPRHETITAALQTKTSLHIPATRRTPLKPLEQLAMVLPQSSFHLLPKEYAALTTAHPHAWPTAWGIYSFGRRFMWECEPLIPLIQPTQIKSMIDGLYEA